RLAGDAARHHRCDRPSELSLRATGRHRRGRAGIEAPLEILLEPPVAGHATRARPCASPDILEVADLLRTQCLDEFRFGYSQTSADYLIRSDGIRGGACHQQERNLALKLGLRLNLN